MKANNALETKYDISDAELEFAIFCIENLGEHLSKNAKDVYRMLTDNNNLLDDYIIYGYNALHTQGKEYIMEDITDMMRRRGLAV